jgi:hypothetical protein
VTTTETLDGLLDATIASLQLAKRQLYRGFEEDDDGGFILIDLKPTLNTGEILATRSQLWTAGQTLARASRILAGKEKPAEVTPAPAAAPSSAPPTDPEPRGQ